MKLLLASHNRYKFLEVSSLFIPHTIVMPQQEGIEFSFEENGSTFIENALGKALHLHTLSHQTTLADDSGLIVDALGGEPGIFSARYGMREDGVELDARERNQFLLDKMKDIPPEKRSARFVCAMALVVSPSRLFIIQESVEGHIALSQHGEGGFGYDPIFIPLGESKTMAQLGEVVKNSSGHRALAAKRVKAVVNSIEEEKIVYVS